MEESSLSQNRWQEPRSIFACLSALSAILKRRMGSRKASINRVTLTCAKRWRNLHRWTKDLSAREAFTGKSSWREGFAGLARPKLHQARLVNATVLGDKFIFCHVALDRDVHCPG